MNTTHLTTDTTWPAPLTMSARCLTKTYGEGNLSVHAVHAVDLDLAAGQVTLIMGPSGSGKTTLLLMLGAMLRPSAGSITIDGVDLAQTHESALPPLRARYFGFVFQDFNLISSLDAAENVELACNLGGRKGRAAHERAVQLLSRLGLAQRLHFRPHELSGGEKQRVAIARALANDPRVVLADEPTANLDSAHSHEIGRLLRDLAVEHGCSVVIVSHDDRLKQIADRVLWLQDGRFSELAALAIDPVCEMAVDTATSLHLGLDDTTFWFCSAHCRDEFLEANEDTQSAGGRKGQPDPREPPPPLLPRPTRPEHRY